MTEDQKQTPTQKWPTTEEWQDLMKMSAALAQSQLIPTALRQKPNDVFIVLMTGKELGIGPMLALRCIHVIEGRPGLAADLIRGLVLRSPLCERFQLIEATEKGATLACKRKGSEEVLVHWAAEETTSAMRSKKNWQDYPIDMMAARVSSRAGRREFPDVIGGLYSVEELEDIRVDAGEAIPGTGAATGAAIAAIPFPTNEQAIATRAEEVAGWIEAVQALAALQALAPRLKQEPIEVQRAVSSRYLKRKAELVGAVDGVARASQQRAEAAQEPEPEEPVAPALAPAKPPVLAEPTPSGKSRGGRKQGLFAASPVASPADPIPIEPCQACGKVKDHVPGCPERPDGGDSVVFDERTDS